MIYLKIRLVGGNEDRLFQNFVVDTQISRSELLKRIEERTNIPIPNQQIQLHGEELSDCVQPLLSVKEFDEITVKHDGLPIWAACLVIGDEMTKNESEDFKSKCAKEGVKLLEKLENTRFFATYLSFYQKFMDLSDEFDSYNQGVEEISLAVRRTQM